MENYQTSFTTTRFFDLDSQRHVNSATYLSYVRQGQFDFLHNLGYDTPYFTRHGIYLKPELIHVQYLRQLAAHVPLEVRSNAWRMSNSIYWDQQIVNRDSGELSAHLTTLMSVDENLLDKISLCDEEFPEPLLTWDIRQNFTNTCKRSEMDYRVRHIDLDGFNQCSDIVLWRLNEEARWRLLEDVGVSFGELLRNDLSLFWINGIYCYYGEVGLNDPLKVYTWISRVDKVRIYIRQEIFKDSGKGFGDRILRTEGEFLAVALSRSKPIRVPEILRAAFEPYMENTQ